MRRITTLLMLATAMLATGFVAGCDDDHHHHHDVYIKDGRLVRVPPGGADFGAMGIFASKRHLGELFYRDDANGYTFTLLDEASLIVSVEALAGFDPYIEIYGPFGNFLASDDDGGIGVDALLVGNQPAGAYTVLVWSSLTGPSSGKYEINVLTGSPAGADLEQMQHGEDVTINGELFAGDDSFTYVFTLVDPSHVDFDLAQFATGAADIAFELVDQRGNQVFFFDPDGLADPIVIDEPLAEGTYLLVVSNEASAGPGGFLLTVRVKP